jgi:GH35 family endo-1,4-beta-xylanase
MEVVKMIKRIVLFLIIICAIYSLKVQAQPVPDGSRLRDIVASGYNEGNGSIIIGATTGAWLLNSNTGEILDREFNYVTPENDFKQWSIHPDNSSSWTWWQVDEWASHIDSNDQILRMHCPIGPQCSNWAKNDERTPEELDTNMCVFLDSLCKRCNGIPGFKYMDVVNETVNGGSWHTNKPGIDWECPWYIMGMDTHDVPIYIVKAFEICDPLAPDIKLIYNHHEHPENTASWNIIKETVLYLKALGLRVDGIGWQAHVDLGWESESRLNNLRNLIDWAHSNDLEFHVTEASVWIYGEPTEENLEEQGDTYRSILDVLLEKRFTGKVGWNIWHIDDNWGWYTDRHPSLFDDNYEAKPAYYAIQAALESEAAGIEEISPEEEHIALKLYNRPNPFTMKTNINFETLKKSYVKVSIYDLSGRELSTVFSGEIEAGKHSLDWNADGLSAGIYICRVETANSIMKHSMVHVK